MSATFAARLLDWHARAGRHDLPWQQPRSLYRVWVAEIMLQQTRVGTVIPYYERFMRRFPDLRSLAAAELDEVLHHWSGLGYYARARNLHRAAGLVASDHGGEFPHEFEAVATLPGIGRSTAGAILAQALGQRHAILDGNARRVLARFHAVAGWPGEARVERALWALAERHTPVERVADYTQAIMDLGATVCHRARPACTDCPVAECCAARRLGRQADFPGRRPARPRPRRRTRMLLVTDSEGAVLLERRPPSGIWGGLWCPPELEAGDAGEWVASRLGAKVQAVEALAPVAHGFTHFELEIVPFAVRLAGTPARAMEPDRWVWYNARSPARLGLAAVVSRLIAVLAQSRAGPEQE